MKLGSSAFVLGLFTAFVATACGGTTGDSLFNPNQSFNSGTFGTGGYSYAGAAGQTPFSTGGASYGGVGNGGFAGTFGNGGIGFGAGGQGFGGFGGVLPDGGPSPGGSIGFGGTDASTPPSDAPFNPLGCDFAGTWASYVAIDVTWPASIVLQNGQGKLQQWNLTHEVHGPSPTIFTAHTRPCSIFLPDLTSTLLVAFQKFGIRFPDALFDKGTIPESSFNFIADISTSPISFQTDPFAILIGVDLANPVTAAWPAATAMTLRDDDHDSEPGITVTPVQNAGYSLPPADLATGESADLVYIATRTVSKLNGQLTSCDRIEADVTIQTVNGKPGIDSTVVGCHKKGGTDCSPDEASFVDGARPQFTPTGPGHMVIVRVPDTTTCPDVRARFPQQGG